MCFPVVGGVLEGFELPAKDSGLFAVKKPLRATTTRITGRVGMVIKQEVGEVRRPTPRCGEQLGREGREGFHNSVSSLGKLNGQLPFLEAGRS